MGGICSKGEKSVNPYAGRSSEEYPNSRTQKVHWNESPERKSSEAIVPPAVPESMRKEVEEQPKDQPGSGYSSSEDEFYDGIPRYRRSRSQKSRSRRVAKVSELCVLYPIWTVEFVLS